MLDRSGERAPTWTRRPQGRAWEPVVLACLTLLACGPAAVWASFDLTWAKKWHDPHWESGNANTRGYGIVTDAQGDVYISGFTRDGLGLYYGFITKFDRHLNELWYSRDYMPATTWRDGVHRVALAPDGNIIAHATAVIGTDTYARVMKVSQADGTVMWQQDFARNIPWADIWDGAAGPVVDAAGNIYVVTGLGADRVKRNGEPLGIYKLDPDGALLWSAQDALKSYAPDALGWDDIWEIAVDSDGALYISATAHMSWDTPRGLDYGLVKYTPEGVRDWYSLRDYGTNFDAPRGLVIGPDDSIYQSGNVYDYDPAVRKFDKYGNVLLDMQVAQKVNYPYGTVLDAEGNLVLHGIYGPENTSEFSLYSPDLVKLDSFEYQFPGCASSSTSTRGARDPWGNLYLMQWFQDSERGYYDTVGVVKIGDRYIPEPGSGAMMLVGLAVLANLRRRCHCPM